MTRIHPFPVVSAGEWVAICSEASTGIVSMPDGRWAEPKDQPYFVFSSREAAESFAIATIRARPSLECGIYEREGPAAKIYRDETVEPSSDVSAGGDLPSNGHPGVVRRLFAWFRRQSVR